MSDLEKKLFLVFNLGMVASYYVVPWSWANMNDAKSSFMAELYWVPLLLCVASWFYGAAFWWIIIKSKVKR